MITKNNVLVLSIVFLFIHTSYSQISKNNLLLGISGTYEINNKVANTSINFEYEMLDLNSTLLGVGLSGKYCNFSSTTNKNLFIVANANLNFRNIAGKDFVPFLGISGGTNFDTKDNLYGVNVGCRYSIEKNFLILFKNSFNNRDALSPEIGIEYRF